MLQVSRDKSQTCVYEIVNTQNKSQGRCMTQVVFFMLVSNLTSKYMTVIKRHHRNPLTFANFIRDCGSMNIHSLSVPAFIRIQVAGAYWSLSQLSGAKRQSIPG